MQPRRFLHQLPDALDALLRLRGIFAQFLCGGKRRIGDRSERRLQQRERPNPLIKLQKFPLVHAQLMRVAPVDLPARAQIEIRELMECATLVVMREVDEAPPIRRRQPDLPSGTTVCGSTGR